MNIRRRVHLSLVLFAILSAGLVLTSWPAAGAAVAQAHPPTPTATATVVSIFSKPELIFTSGGEIQTPILLADQTGHLHLFYTLVEPVDTTDSSRSTLLEYSRYDNGKWSPPVDVAVADTLLLPTAAIDSQGILHVIWSGATKQIFYTSVLLEKAADPRSWTTPVVLATGNMSAHLLIDQQDVLHVVYPGGDAKGPYYFRSTDGGKHWSAAVNISPTMQENASADYVRMAIGPKGILHVVWSEFQLPTGSPPTGVLYSQSTDGGASWTRPKVIKGMRYDQINIAVKDENTIHVAWNAMDTLMGRYHSWSQDGGKTWAEMDILSKLGGTEGLPQMAIDSAGTLHLVVTYDHCPYYFTWLGDHFSDPLCLLNDDNLIKNLGWSKYIEEPAMAILNGNEVHVVFWDNRNRLYHTYARLEDASPVPTAPFATYTPTVALTATSTQIPPKPTETPAPPEISEGEISHNTSPLGTLPLDLLPSFAVVVVVVIIFWLRSVRRR